MLKSLTLGQQIALGILTPFVLLLVTILPYTYRSAETLNEVNRQVAHTQQVLLRTSEFLSAIKDTESAQLGLLLTGKDDFLETHRLASEIVERKYEELRRLTADSPTQQQRLQEMLPLLRERQHGTSELRELRRQQGLVPAAQLSLEGRGRHSLEELRKLATTMAATEEELLRQHSLDATQAAKQSVTAPVVTTPIAIILMTISVLIIIRNLNRQLGTAVQHIRSAAAELQAAAVQQTRGAKGQTATATEVATTMRELVSTSRQIAESAQRVTGIAADTTAAARVGDHTVLDAQAAVEQVKHQVNRIVTHMLDLGKKSQEIGSILDIINELAEQTNILAINATIEAAGAGDAGRRFSVVADEIRKLADRVGGSTKEIRTLIQDVRAAANTTVMVTEDGSKAVDVSAGQFGKVAASFRQIVELVGNTAEASHEIELSTKQQTTAVEQASTAITEVADTARDTEASSSQTIQTAGQLASLSQQLMKLVRSGE
ncbi:MAG: methyl-accepting chemotaxis protein [Verrucomicrobiota bacterium]